MIFIFNYLGQTLLLTKDDSDRDNVQNVLIMSITTRNWPVYTTSTFTCNVSSLNKGAAAPIEVIQAASNINANIEKNNIITDMIYMEYTKNVFIAHLSVYPNSTREYPLTVRSNYQEIGEWKLKSKSKDASDEFDKFDDFIDKVIEMRKIFKLNPSMVLFLQDVDVRDYSGIDSKITKTRLDKMKNDLIREAADLAAAAVAAAAALANVSGFDWFIAVNVDNNKIDMDSPCNIVDKKVKNIMYFA